ncbi:unnamed protein product [Rodentolepis nana]|uniref:Uncharacterized protein n=1 Tax=Rodentolepis nana TaxID=102285 RepID=A0A3P7VAQ2_RODNA|nr:unnamed protein product [Rodentolepis nana]
MLRICRTSLDEYIHLKLRFSSRMLGIFVMASFRTGGRVWKSIGAWG